VFPPPVAQKHWDMLHHPCDLTEDTRFGELMDEIKKLKRCNQKTEGKGFCITNLT